MREVRCKKCGNTVFFVSVYEEMHLTKLICADCASEMIV